MTQYEVTAAGQYLAANPVQAARWFAEEAANGQPFSYLDVRDREGGGRFVVDLESGTFHNADHLQTVYAMPRPTMHGIEIPYSVKADKVLDALGGIENFGEDERLHWQTFHMMAGRHFSMPIATGRLIVIGRQELGELWADGRMVDEDDFGTEAFVATSRTDAMLVDAQVTAGSTDIRVTMNHQSFIDGTELADYIAWNAKLAQAASLKFLGEANRQLRQYAGDNPAVVLDADQFKLLLVMADAYFDDDEAELGGMRRIDLAMCATDRDKLTDLAVAVRQAMEYERDSTALSKAQNGQEAKNGSA